MCPTESFLLNSHPGAPRCTLAARDPVSPSDGRCSPRSAERIMPRRSTNRHSAATTTSTDDPNEPWCRIRNGTASSITVHDAEVMQTLCPHDRGFIFSSARCDRSSAGRSDRPDRGDGSVRPRKFFNQHTLAGGPQSTCDAGAGCAQDVHRRHWSAHVHAFRHAGGAEDGRQRGTRRLPIGSG